MTAVRATGALAAASLLVLGPVVAQERSDGSDQGARSGIDRAAFDPSVRPQDDFNDYVSGTWIAETEIPPGMGSWNLIQEMRQQVTEAVRDIIETASATGPHLVGSNEQLVADFFRSYMDSDLVEKRGIEPIADRLEAIRDTRTAAELQALAGRMMREGVSGPLTFYPGPDLDDSSRYIAWLNQSRLTLPIPEDYLADDQRSASVREGFVTYAAQLFTLAGMSAPDVHARAVLEIETGLAGMLQPIQETRDVAGFNPYEVASLRELSTGIDWPAFLTSLGLGRESRVVISAPRFVSGLGRLLEEEPLEHWKSFWTFQLLHSRAELLPAAFVQARFDFMGRQIGAQSEPRPRSARAIQLMSGEVFDPPAVLAWPIAELYVERHLPPAAKARLERMVEQLRSAYARSIDGLDWMSDETKAEAQRKLENLYVRIGYPDAWPDSSALHITSDDLIGNVRRAFAHAHNNWLERLSREAWRGDWINVPHWMYALADLSNAAEFPAAFLQPPLFDANMDDAYNYAGVGFVIGHELGHNFDNQGRHTDADGQLRDWWTAEDAQQFERRAGRLVDYFNAIEPLEGLPINGEATLSENIADLAGLTVAYEAYLTSLDGQDAPVLDGFTGAQRFLISYARVSRTAIRESSLRQSLRAGRSVPWKQRINGPLRHFAPFYEVFGVREGDGMWLPPEARVKIW